jgi:aspartate aminotransferase
MQVISTEVSQILQNASWIRRMFEAGIELKQKHGADKVCDFTLGNPDLPPVPEVGRTLRRLADTVDQPLSLGYMPNAGLTTTRQRLAEYLAKEQQVPLTTQQVIVTCARPGTERGVSHGPRTGDEVICPSPYFVEYGFYVGNFGGSLVPVPSKPSTFALDLDAIKAAITDKTRAVLIDSPNNPTGVVYNRAELETLAALLTRAGAGRDRPIYLVSDEPYRFLAYDGVEVPPILPLYPFSVVVGSFSKSLSLAGERIGYIAVSPAMPLADPFLAGLILCNRILGYVNAPVIGQRLVEAVLGATVDVGVYKSRRDAMADILRDAGIEFALPKGAFYFFPKVPGRVDDARVEGVPPSNRGQDARDTIDDVQFCQLLQDELVLAVPGRGFGLPGYFRLTYCMDEAIIRRAAKGFQRAADRARSR